MHKVAAYALLLLAAVLSPAAAQTNPFNPPGNYLYTGQTGAQTQIDIAHTSTWNIEVPTGGTAPFSGAKLTMKRGTSTSANVTFTLYDGADATGTVLCQVDLSPADFTTSFQEVTFLCPGAPLTLGAGSYFATLTSPARDAQSTGYFIKGYSDSVIASGLNQGNPTASPDFAPTATSSGLNLLKTAVTTSIVNETQTYTISIGNSGPNDLTATTAISFIDQLPDGVSATSCASTSLNSLVCAPYAVPGALLTCNATLAATLFGTGNGTDPAVGPSVTCIVTMPDTAGEITNWASIDPAGGDSYPAPVNCTLPPCAQATTLVQDPPAPLLTVDKKSDPKSVPPVQQVNYTISIGNEGTANLAAGSTITVLDQLWEGATLVGAEPGPGIAAVACVEQPPPVGLLNCTVTLDNAALVVNTTAADGFNFILTINAPDEQFAVCSTDASSTAICGFGN